MTVRKIIDGTLRSEKKVPGPEHPEALVCMANLGLMLQRQGKLAAAVEMHEDAFMLRRKVLGPNHPDTIVSLDYFVTSFDSPRRLKNSGRKLSAGSKITREKSWS